MRPGKALRRIRQAYSGRKRELLNRTGARITEVTFRMIVFLPIRVYSVKYLHTKSYKKIVSGN